MQLPAPKISIIIEVGKIGNSNVDEVASEEYDNEPLSSVSTNDHSTGICEITSDSEEEEEEYDISNVEPEYDLG